MIMRKILLGGLIGTAAIGATLALAGPANADTVSTATNCTPVIAHTEYKWVPNVTNAGPTQWTTDPAAANTPRTFLWKGAPVAYHRDGTKSQFIAGVTCAVTEPVSTYDGKCSVTIPFVPGIDTRLFGVNGHPETDPITEDVTVSAGLDGAGNTAPQFWVGYTAQPGYTITNPGAALTHVDFYNGDYIADCTA